MSRPQVTHKFAAAVNGAGAWSPHIASGKCAVRVSGDYNGILYVDSAINPEGVREDAPQDADGITLTQVSGPRAFALDAGAGCRLRFRLANNTSGSVTALICQGE
ncbi:hypothetical protein N1030_01745 [Desulfovibrio mangrovi]|uniref:hypothetical protein n=1 Tax=Desulfovibrio mangrovi TaxID=2976983 RepID=UPI002246C0C1|nr:hypothetical protein [Desulfovibrio mangrovi]UZP67718.1 hypothetical protein N1030_01745 [Desulfovibrio mangrovi]